MSGRQKVLALTLALAGSVVVSGCYYRERVHQSYGAPAPGYATYEYYYYPDTEVYYYPYRHVYYWNEGGRWRYGRSVPRTYVLRSHVTVNLDSREPWRRHDEIRSRYPRDWHPDNDRRPDDDRRDAPPRRY